VEEAPDCWLHLPWPPQVTELCPCPMRFEVLTAMAKTGSRYCHWEDSASPFFRIEKKHLNPSTKQCGVTFQKMPHYV